MQQKIQTFLNTCLRRIFNIRWPEKIRNEELWERAGQEPVAKQILRRKWGWIGHTLRKPASSTTRQALTWNPQGKRKRGRPRNSWRRDTEAELFNSPKPVIPDTVLLNEGGAYSGTTGRFTVPYTGTYFLIATAADASSSSGDYGDMRMMADNQMLCHVYGQYVVNLPVMAGIHGELGSGAILIMHDDGDEDDGVQGLTWNDNVGADLRTCVGEQFQFEWRYTLDNTEMELSKNWTAVTPSGRKSSSKYQDGRFYLQLPNPVEGGEYSCILPSTDPATSCLPDGSLLETALVVDETNVRLTLLEAENTVMKAAVKDLKAENKDLKAENKDIKTLVSNNTAALSERNSVLIQCL
nr:hypothetical protein BaRGS_009752 [Batillaria attramentaria]